MNITVLAFTACLAGAPEQCTEYELIYLAEELTAHQCMIVAPQMLAAWSTQRPGWRVTEYQCASADERGLPA